MSLRRYAVLATALIVGLAIMLGGAQMAGASHYRANQLTWHQTSGNTVEFHVTGSWRCSFFFSAPCSASIGDTFSVPGVNTGDGTFLSGQMTVTAVDVVNDVVSGSGHVTHTYSGPGPWTASVSDCCRLSSFNGHMNNGDGSVRFETIVDLTQTSASPVSLISPIVDCPLNALCSFTVPAADADGQGLRWRFATATEASGSATGFTQPAGATINATTGLYQWNTTGAALAPSGSTFYSTQIMVENVVGSTVVSKTPVDFFIRLGSNSTNAQPVFVAPTPADGSVIAGTVGSPMSFSVAATDPDTGDVVTLAMLGQPAGSSYSPTAGNPATGTFSWTPTATGDYLITLTAVDQQGLGAVPRGIILRIGIRQATTTVAGKGRFNTRDGQVTFELSNDSVSLDKPRGTAVEFDGDVDSIAGSGNSATLTGTGTYNGVAGYSFVISVVDGAQEWRTGDTIDVVIRDLAGVIVFSTAGREPLKLGNIVVTTVAPD
jgi:hypothetical protein